MAKIPGPLRVTGSRTGRSGPVTISGGAPFVTRRTVGLSVPPPNGRAGLLVTRRRHGDGGGHGVWGAASVASCFGFHLVALIGSGSDPRLHFIPSGMARCICE
jgi:hypothetical protein